MRALKQGKGLVTKGCREEGEVVKSYKNAIYLFLLNLAFRCTKTAIREPGRRQPRVYPIFFPLMFIWYCVAIWRVACAGVAW